MKIKKLLLFTLALLLFLVGVKVNATSGYMYNYKGDPIYSPEGFTVNQQPLSYGDLQIFTDANKQKPEDLFVYKKDGKPELIYLTDSLLNSVYVFDTNFSHQLQHFSWCILKPSELYETTATAIKSNGNVLFETTEDVPTDAELNNPLGKYAGKGFVKLQLSAPTATYRLVQDSGEDFIYICDSGNNQIVVLDAESYNESEGTYQVHQIVTKPTDELPETQFFVPQKMIVDTKGRMYVIVNTVFEGIMQFSKQGTFDRYTGTNRVTLTPLEVFWRNFSTEAQLKSQTLLRNTTFNSIAYDPDKFMIYATSLAIPNKSGEDARVMIKKINTSGDDTLRRNGYKEPMGDVFYERRFSLDDRKHSGPSQLRGITFNEDGIYSVVDSNMGRIFTYDNEGHLLYIAGGQGIQADKITKPVAIQYLGDDILVLDANKGTIIRFELTQIAKLINKAVKCEQEGYIIRPVPKFNPLTKTWWIGDIDTGRADPNAEISEDGGQWQIGGIATGVAVADLAASDYWEQVIKLNSNYEYAYVGIGRKYMKEENYKEAMRYFKMGHLPEYYSKAYKLRRDHVIKKWFAPVAIVLAALIIGGLIFRHYWRKKKGYKEVEETGIGDE